jgi:hypothetical protein
MMKKSLDILFALEATLERLTGIHFPLNMNPLINFVEAQTESKTKR